MIVEISDLKMAACLHVWRPSLRFCAFKTVSTPLMCLDRTPLSRPFIRSYLKNTPQHRYRWSWQRKLEATLIKMNALKLVASLGLLTSVLLGFALVISPGFRTFFTSYRPWLAKLIGLEVPSYPSSALRTHPTSIVKRDLQNMVESDPDKKPVVP